VKLLFDENLSRKLVTRLADLYPGSRHVNEIGLDRSPDSAIFDHAKAMGFTVVTSDADFFEFVTTFGPPPKVIWLRRWRHPTRDAEAILRKFAIRVTKFEADLDAGILILESE
jgi:predicted nuclease of predicted toxin-antitoxin system